MKHNIIPHSKPTISKKECIVAAKVIASGMLAQGKYVKSFESAVANYIGVKDGVATSSGTAALHLALLALGVGRGDEVLIPTYVCTALLNAIKYVDATLKLVDVNWCDGNINAREAKKRVTKKTKAIIVPHMFGMPANITELKKLGVPIIEDLAQSIGATFNGKKVGTFGDIAICSFYATKMMTTGEGGMVLSNSRAMLNKIRDLRDYDNKISYALRFNYKMTDIQAVLGIEQLKQLNNFIKRRRMIARMYDQQLGTDTGICPQCELPRRRKGRGNVYFRYVIKVSGSAVSIIKKLRAQGIYAASPIFKPLHSYLQQKGFPIADKLMQHAISLPIYPSLTDKGSKRIISAVKE
ncbi:MAG: DegT/DnrJ/EryC1/StrS aminotransferase family protein [Candidatus Omnitrophica bacterium]|nr:DegT/DnrJ/EryC1/StrS aminotransferase family protein [Candidatus Omnitrophota bacterium]